MLHVPLFLAGVFDFEELHMLNRGHRDGLSSCYYLVEPTNMREKLNIELFCTFGKVKVTVPSPPPPPALTVQGRFLFKGGGGRGV